MPNKLNNIVIIGDFGSIVGGAERIIIETALALKQEGFRVIFFCAVSPVSETLTDNGI